MVNLNPFKRRNNGTQYQKSVVARSTPPNPGFQQGIQNSADQMLKDLKFQHSLELKERDKEFSLICRQLDDSKAQCESNRKSAAKARSQADELDQNIREIRANAQREREKHAEANRTTVAEAQQERLRYISEHEAYISDLVEQYESRLKSSEQALQKTQIDALRQREELEAHFVRETEALRKRMEQDHYTKESELVHQHHVQKQEMQTCLDGINRNHAEVVQHMRSEVEGLNDALLSRDDEVYAGSIFVTSSLPRKPDDELKKNFSQVTQLVDELCRIPWRQNQALWTDTVLQRVKGQPVPRLLRKEVLQHLTWTMLYEYVFSSPFRIFGEEGSKLESEWAAHKGAWSPSAGKDTSSPVPSSKAERWRYMTVKECREALLKPAPSEHDPRGRLKKGFELTKSQLITSLEAAFGELVDLDAQSRQMLGQVSRKAASTWLDFEMHRCRIVVSLSGSRARSAKEMVAQLQQCGSLELSVMPRLGRHGNVKGSELNTYVAIEEGAGNLLQLA